MNPHRDRGELLLYQNRGDLLLKVAMIFMIQASTVARIASLQGAPTQADASRPTLKLFVDALGICHVANPTGPTNVLASLRSFSVATNQSPQIALYVDQRRGVPSGEQLLAPLLLIRQTVPAARTTLATYETER